VLKQRALVTGSEIYRCFTPWLDRDRACDLASTSVDRSAVVPVKTCHPNSARLTARGYHGNYFKAGLQKA
jgi:hypothetical protein